MELGTKKMGEKSAVLLLCGWLFCTVWTGSAAAEPLVVNKKAMAHVSPAQLVIREVSGMAVNTKKPSTAVDLIPQIIKDVTPSVVGIIGKSSGERYVGVDERYNLMHGSGIIVKSNGWIITNAHVVKDLQNTVVVTSDGKTYKIIKTYMDEVSDLALIKINAAALKPAKLAKSSSNARVGEKVIAIGTPISFALRSSATTGVIESLADLIVQ
ncbi:trypsin-like peptidase domain-containing protein [Paenibacillus wynnii]|uniref:trypsin-like peptidase domain-containing protein n=1 Tax=Paenibacillus wynnii TaxID=268407 RepID=UPI003B835247